MQVLLAKNFELDKHDPTGWLASEKLDGIRAVWTGHELLTRNGNKLWAPDWFLSQLPSNCPLDGELWLARQEFQQTMSIVRKQTPHPGWKEITYKVFDAPEARGGFEDRLREAERCLQGSTVATVLNHQICRDRIHLKTLLDQIVSIGGEGMMLRKPGSAYERKRSSILLKLKKFTDAEAEVIDHTEGEGKYKGDLGALIVKTSTGVIFDVGSGFTDSERRNPPPIGSIITYRFTDFTKAGKPKCASFVSIRAD